MLHAVVAELTIIRFFPIYLVHNTGGRALTGCYMELPAYFMGKYLLFKAVPVVDVPIAFVAKSFMVVGGSCQDRIPKIRHAVQVVVVIVKAPVDPVIFLGILANLVTPDVGTHEIDDCFGRLCRPERRECPEHQEESCKKTKPVFPGRPRINRFVHNYPQTRCRPLHDLT